MEHSEQTYSCVLRKQKLEEIAVMGRIEGKRSPAHQRLTYLNWLEKAIAMKPSELIKPFKDRKDKDILTVA